MSVRNSNHIDLLSRYAVCGENGFYIDPASLRTILVDELNLSMSFDEIKQAVMSCKIILTEEEIQKFLDERRKEEYSNLNKELSSTSKMIFNGYDFNPYTLEYFKTYISVLKIKCMTLFDILNDLENIKRGIISSSAQERIVSLDFHINENGDVYLEDADRFLDAFIYNVEDLLDKVHKGNTYESYLIFRISKEDLAKEGIRESEIYPRKEVQVKDLYYSSKREFIALGDNQRESIRKQEINNYEQILKRVLK